MDRRFLSFLWLFIAAVCLSGCGLVEQVRVGGVDLGSYGVTRETAVFLTGGQPRTLDPAKTHAGPSGVIGHVYSGLVVLDTNLQIQPELAAGWDVSADGLVYTFFLRENVVFHNGRSLTAEDVAFSWERAADPLTESDTALTYLGDIDGVADKLAGNAETIRGVTVLDTHTLQVRLHTPAYTFLPKLAFPVANVVDQETVDQPDWERSPHGTGPFKLELWEDDSLILLERNDAYYLQPATIEHVVLDLGPSLALASYEQDEIDLVGIGGSNLARALNPNDPLAPDLRVGVPFCTTMIGLNNNQPPFDDVRVRQAFNYGLDKARLVETFWDGNGLVANGVLPPGLPGFSTELVGYPFDADHARSLLAEAGYVADENGRLTNFPTLTYSTAGYGAAGSFVTAVITLWQDTLGVTIEPIVIDPFVYREELYAGTDDHIFGGGWCADYPDPENFLDLLYHSDARENIGRFASADIDQALVAARSERDVATRIAAYQSIEAELVEAAPVVFVAHGQTAVLVKPWLQNYVLTPIGVPQWHHVSVKRNG
ncbi:MAG: peptide ABC transporter substrate-binding protein [Chloroflexota bacterium]